MATAADITYLDNNATTRVDPRVLAAMLPLLTDRYGNPSSTHSFGASVMAEIEDARARVAALIGGRPQEVFFTSGGTEANNTALRGLVHGPRRKLIVSAVEHSSVLEPAAELAREGCALVHAAVDRDGVVDLDHLRATVDAQTAVVSLMLVNNESGVIQPVAKAAEIAHRAGALLHTDAVQAAGKLPVNVRALGADLLTLSAHKLHGPKGAGALFVRDGVPLRPLLRGGPQERERRGGTLNAAGIAGFGAAAALCDESLTAAPRVAALRDRLEGEVLRMIRGARVIGAGAPRVCNTSCVLLPGVAAEPLLLLLSEAGVCASSGAACSSGSLEPSHVLLAMGFLPDEARGELRFSLSRETTDGDIDRALAALAAAHEKLSRLEGRA